MSSFVSGVVVSVFVLLVVGAQGLLSGRGNRTVGAEGRAIEQECLQLAEQGSCDFYTCFERRLPCGRNWYILRQGWYYCDKAQRLRDGFSSAGQQFLTDTQRCMTRSLKTTYQQDTVDCHALEHAAVSSMRQCAIDNAFCTVYNTDSTQFMSIYETSDLFGRGALKLWRAFTSLIGTCVRRRFQQFSSDAAASIVNAFSSWGNLGSN